MTEEHVEHAVDRAVDHVDGRRVAEALADGALEDRSERAEVTVDVEQANGLGVDARSDAT